MAGFEYQRGKLFCEEVDLASVAEDVGTPCFIYSGSMLMETYGQFQRALKPLPGIICYALKANGSLALCKMLASRGCGADVVSGGELYRALKVGFPPERIVFSGVGKTEQEIRLAINANIRQLNVESLPELDLVAVTARKLETRARIALRVNPDVRPDTHPYLTTGAEETKFGLNLKDSLSACRKAAAWPNIQLTGLHFHLGSQITSTEPYVEALQKVLALIDELRGLGITISELDIGGGLGIAYHDETVPTPQQWLDAIRDDLKRSGCTVIIEPGRALVGPAGVLLTRTLYLKKTLRKNFLVVDAGMNDLVRLSLYGAFHHISPVWQKTGERLRVDVVGPVCESADFLAHQRDMIHPEAGDLLAVMNAGAYVASMASNYNGRRRVAEVLVCGQRYALIRRRETFEDLVAHELIPGLVLEACADGREAD